MRSLRLIRSAAASAALLLGVGLASAQDAAPAQMDEGLPPAGLLVPIPLFAEARNLPLPLAMEEWATPVSPVLLDEPALLRLRIGTHFVLDLEPGVSLVCSVERVGRAGERRVTLGGSLQGTLDGTFAFAVCDDAVAMVVRVPSEQRLYRLQFMGGGAYWVESIDEALLPDCGGSVAPPAAPPRIPEPDDDDDLPPGGAPRGGERGGGGCAASTPMLDMMVVYTPAARTAAGGHAAIRAEAALAVDQTNFAYANSLNSVRARLVYCDEVPYLESGVILTDLDRLTGTNDGFMDSVHAIRDSVNADLVSLYVLDPDFAGIGHCISGHDTGFSVCDWTLAAPNFTHAHETGHNLGCDHDRDNATGGECGGDYGFGWRFYAGTPWLQYRTVMAYAPGTRIGYFSNPNVIYIDTPTGVAGSEDNARVINNRDTTIEGFEVTRYDIYVDFAWDGPEAGLYAMPYDTVPEGVNAIAIPSTGAVEYPNLYIRAGTTNWTGTISKVMTITPCGGAVTMGQ